MNDFNYAERVKKIKPAISQDLIAKVRALRADGVEVIDFHVVVGLVGDV